MDSALRFLTGFQHLLLVALTSIGLVRAVTLGASPASAVALTVAFLGWYVLGVVFSRRRRVHGGAGPGAPASRETERTGRVPGATSGAGSAVLVWLLGLTALWLVLVALSAEFVWVAFSLWLLAGHFLPWRWSVPYALAVLAVVVVAPWHALGVLTVAGVIGPAIGALFALIVSWGQVQLVRYGVERERLIASLVEAQAEAESLHAQLAATQREAGALGERARLSRDIHDTLAQGFSSIVLLARSAEEVTDRTRQRELLRHIQSTASENLHEARRVVASLAPRQLDGATLPTSLRRLLDSFTDQTGIPTDLRLDGQLDALPTALEVALVRTLQGALANVRRHAHATRVVVSLSETTDSVRLDVVDDGIGFDPRAVDSRPHAPEAGGYGLSSTRARLRELGGGLDVESAPGEGTALTAHVPLRAGVAG
ncbi:sensor histidine kinase [Intrasporangium flavum]|uniref:sensor histidine kinase n=1 Tax=Intrasporangium flavum TaxID=1428657 RepID=UPI00096DFA15|nr:sensor histidine kinase [Intrasporangium flavum]